ncbi:MAG: glycosyltransferase, partial [Thermoplasmata archaeon]
LDPPKNPLRFLEIAKLILQERKDVVFVWIGGSVVEDSYGKQVEQWLLENPEESKNIHFLPFRKDAIELMADFDILLLTSDAEGMPLVVLEAQNLGIPVVSTDVGCITEKDGVTIITNLNELKNFSEKVSAILKKSSFLNSDDNNYKNTNLGTFLNSYKKYFFD